MQKNPVMPSSVVDWKGNSPKTASTLIAALSHTRKHFSNELFICEDSWKIIRTLEVITKRAPRAEARWLCHQSLSQHGDRVDGLWFLVRNTTHWGFPCLLGRLWLDNEMHTLGTRARSVFGENWFHRFGFGNCGDADGLKLRLKPKRRPWGRQLVIKYLRRKRADKDYHYTRQRVLPVETQPARGNLISRYLHGTLLRRHKRNVELMKNAISSVL